MSEASCDIVTQLQQSLDQLSVSLFSTLGALQRDAQPISVRGEPAEEVPNKAKSQDLAKGWATELVAISSTIDSLIQKLPDVSCTEQEELERVVAVMKANDEIGLQLHKELDATGKVLNQVRDLYGLLADAELAERATGNARQ